MLALFFKLFDEGFTMHGICPHVIFRMSCYPAVWVWEGTAFIVMLSPSPVTRSQDTPLLVIHDGSVPPISIFIFLDSLIL